MHLACLLAHVRAREHIAKILVFAGVLHLDTHAQFVQRLFEIHRAQCACP